MIRRSARFLLGSALAFGVSLLPAHAAEIPIEGVVRGLDGAAVPGTRVELRPAVSRYEAGLAEIAGGAEPAPVAHAVVDSRGRFRLSAPRTGLWRLAVAADGYVPMEISALPILEETRVPPLALRVDRGLRVRVVDADGNPVAGARVIGQTGEPALWGADWQPLRRLAVSGAEGTLRLARDAAESLRLWAAAPGFPAQGGALADGPEATLQLGAGPPRSLLALDAESHPLAEALFRDPRSSLVLGRFDGRQPLVLAAPATGLWDLRVELADGRRITFRTAETQRPEESSPIPLRLTPAVPLAGRILGVAGRRPLAGALVWSAGDPGTATRTDAAGAYRLAGRVSGSPLNLRAAAAGHQPGRLEASLPSNPSESQRQAPDLLLIPAAVPTLAGRVVDAASRPVAGAEIHLVRPDPEDSLAAGESHLATTLPDGSFRLAPLEAGGVYALTASRAGFAPATLIVAMPLPPSSRPPVRLVLARGRTVSGLVLDPRQRPIPGALVKLESPEPIFEVKPVLGPFRAATDAEGRFRIAGLPAGLFELRIEGPELAPLPAKTIAVPQGDGLLDLGTFTLASRSRIAGWIVDAGGRPVEGVDLWVVASESTITTQAARQAGRAAVTDRDGRFELRNRAVGDQEKLRACRKGFLPAEFQAQGPAAGEPRIVLTPTTRIAGTVVSAEGDPLPGARVLAYPSSGPAGSDLMLPDPPCPFELEAVAGAAGDFVLELREPGRYDVNASGAGHLRAELAHVLVPPEGLEGLELRMDGGTIVTGHVSDPQGHAIAGAVLSLSSSRSFTKASTDGDGEFLLEGVEPGDQSLWVEHPDFQGANQEVHVPAAGTRLNLTLSRASGLEIRGRVSGPGGSPVEGALVSSTSDKTATLADGSFGVRVNPGAGRLVVEKEGFAVATLDVTVADRSLDGIEIRLGHGLTLTGRVLGVDPAAVTGSTILVQTRDARQIPALIDAAGRFEVPNLPPEAWMLSAQAGEREASEQVIPRPGETEVVMRDLEFAPTSEVRGSVTGPDGQPIAGASLELAGRQGARLHTQTQADGSFVIAAPDGTYTLSASAEGYAGRETNPPIVIAGAPVEDVEIRLGTDIVLSGRLLGLEQGDALEDLKITGPPAFHPGAWTVGPNGRYRQMGLWPGDWTVSAVFDLEGQKRLASGAVHIPSGATEATLDLDFHLGDLTLTVRPMTSTDAFDAYLFNGDGSDLMQYLSARDGAYRYSHLRAGTYQLNYRKGRGRQIQQLELTADQELVIDPNVP